jgi:hypothetical protein
VIDPILGLIILGLGADFNKVEYLGRVEGVLMCVEDSDDRLYHNQDGSLNKTRIFADLQFAG